MVDRKRHALAYLAYWDRLIEGSPQNSVPIVAVAESVPISYKSVLTRK